MRDSKILIIEDEGVIAEHLKIILNGMEFENIHIANDKERALLSIESFNPNLILLDIRMENELDGIEIAKVINQKYKLPFIFITSHSDNDILDKALETSPSSYITKPFKKSDIYAAINLAIKKNDEVKSDNLFIKDGYDDIIIDFESILYVQSERNYIDIFCENKKFNTRNSLEWFMQNAPDKKFMRIHRSFVINLKKVTKITSSEVLIENIPLPVSRKFLVELREKTKSI